MKTKLAILGLLLILLAFPHHSSAQTLRHDNFEHNTLGMFGTLSQTNGTLSISSTVAHSGTYSLKSDITVAGGQAAGYWQNTNSIVMASSYFRVWVYIPQASFDDMNLNGEYWSIAQLLDVSGSTMIFDVRFYNTGGTQALFVFYNGYALSDAIAAVADTWVCVEVHAVNGTDSFEVWFDGVSQGIDTTANIVDADAGILAIGALGSSGVTGAVYADDFVWDATRYIGQGWRVQEGLAVGSPYQY